jgi:hypothetical protein
MLMLYLLVSFLIEQVPEDMADLLLYAVRCVAEEMQIRSRKVR